MTAYRTGGALSAEQAAAVVRREGRRTLVLGAVGLLLAGLLYLAVSTLLLGRTPGQWLVQGLPLIALIGVGAYFFQIPAWARRARATVSQATVGRVGDGEVTLQGGPQGEVSLPLPRGTSGFRRGDRVWVSPEARAAQVVAVVVPGHVSAPRPVISARTTAVTGR